MDESVISTEQTDTGSKKRRQKKKKTNNSSIKSANADMIFKEKIVDVAEGNSQNNSHDSKDDEEQGTSAQEKIVVNQNKKQKRHVTKVDDDAVSLKKPKINDAKNDDTTVETHNIKIEKNIEEITFVKTSTAVQKKKNKKKKLESNKMKNEKHKPNSESVHQLMSLDAARLKTYGINAKKFKNKLKYGKREL